MKSLTGEDVTEYPEIHEAQMRTRDEVIAKLLLLRTTPSGPVDYITGLHDGAGNALGWVLGLTETCLLK